MYAAEAVAVVVVVEVSSSVLLVMMLVGMFGEGKGVVSL